jgi:ATP-dependent helicase/nuclease subunit A
LILREEERDLQEHWRLLYVALTRAADRLIVSGVMPKSKKDGSDPRPANCWHRAVQQGLVSLGAAPDAEGQAVLVYGSETAAQAARKRAKLDLPAVAIPKWALSPAPPESRPPRPLAPSAAAEDRDAALPPTPDQRAAAERGTMVHALLERLPPVPEASRRQAAAHWLQHSAGVEDAALREEIAECVCQILGDPRFAPLFGPNSLAEAPIAATLPDGRVIAGTVDRLLVEEGRVSVIDYKTGRAPAAEEDIPQSHRLQMRAYCDALSVIFPGRAVGSALLYTATGQLFELAA